MVEQLDRAVGRVLTALEQAGIADRTVVVFMSDNGGLSTAEGHPTSNAPLRAGKGWLYEGGIRVPWIIKAPGVTAQGSTYAGPVLSTDFYPTLLRLTGLPLAPTQHRDGMSLAPVLSGQALDRGPLFWHYPHYSNQGGPPAGAVRDGDWKLIEWYEDGRLELYNLRADPGEQHDLALNDPAKASAMQVRLAAWRRDLGLSCQWLLRAAQVEAHLMPELPDITIYIEALDRRISASRSNSASQQPFRASNLRASTGIRQGKDSSRTSSSGEADC